MNLLYLCLVFGQAWGNCVDPDQNLIRLYIAIIHQFLDTSKGSKTDLFKFKVYINTLHAG